MRVTLFALTAGLLPVIVQAHHSVAGFFNPRDKIEIAGTVTEIVWRNPHTEFRIDVTDEDGAVTAWRVETGALAVLRARGLLREFLYVGDDVQVYGDATYDGRSEVFAHNLLLSDGKEVMLTVGSSEHFSKGGDAELLESIYDEEIIETARRDADGIFRVWSSDLDARRLGARRRLLRNLPVLPEAEASREGWDLSDEAFLGCTQWTMPRLMSNPLPMEFVREGEDVLLRFEEDDSRRLIHLNADISSVPDEFTPMGYSTGYWDGEALVVETTNISSDVLDDLGTKASSELRLIERFTAVDDGSRLVYELTLTDPNTFSEPYQTGREWIWRPEIVVGYYGCNEEQLFQ